MGCDIGSQSKPKYRIGDKVWRKNISPIRYGVAIVAEIVIQGERIEYGVIFDIHATCNIRYYEQSELAP